MVGEARRRAKHLAGDMLGKKISEQFMCCHATEEIFQYPVWNDLLKVRYVYMKGQKMIVGKGERTYFCQVTVY